MTRGGRRCRQSVSRSKGYTAPVLPLSTWLARRKGTRRVRLVSAHRIVAAYREAGAGCEAALDGALAQVRGLRAEVGEDARWHALVELVRRTGDPWNADDWPLGFDPLLCCVPLCTHVDYECVRCPVGRRQDGMSCAHPTSYFGRIGHLVSAGDRSALIDHLARLEELLIEERTRLGS